MKFGVIVIMFLFAFLAIFGVVWSAMTYLTKQKKLSKKQKFQKYNKRFRFYYDFVLSRQTFRKVHTQVASLSVYSFLEARVVSVKFYERALISSVIVFIIGFIGLGDIISGIVLMMFVFVMINETVNKRLNGVNFECLKATSKWILSARECYTRIRNVPDAVNDAKCPPILQRQIDDIYLICTATDAKQRLNRFYEECPNRIIRTLATTCYIRSDTGEEDLGKSPFKQGLSLVKDEVDMEVRRQINQNIMFKALDKLPFVPLFLYPPIQIFYTKLISATSAVFESGVGYIIKLTIVLTCFICYYILSTINNPSIARTDDRLLFVVNLMTDARIVKFAKTLITRDPRKRMKLKKSMEGCLSSKTLEYFYLEKLVISTAMFFASIVFSIIIVISARHSIYNSLSSPVMSVELKYTAQQEATVRELDARVLEMDQCPSKEVLVEDFSHIFLRESTMMLETHADRVIQKYKNYHSMSFKWWFAFVYISCFLVGWILPNFMLRLRVKLVQEEAELDVLQLQTIIAILMDTNFDTLTVIYWLAKSSDIHKSVLTYCYHEYVKDPVYALRSLRDKAANNDFSAMCDKLITTIHQVTVAEAFEDLIDERDNTMKIREVTQLAQLQSKRNLASPIATAPMMVWMAMAFLLPLVIVAARSAVNMLGNLDKLNA